MSHHHETKEEKKKRIRERNKRNWMIFQHAELLREKVDIGAPEGERKTLGKFTKKEQSAAAKMPAIHNMLLDRKVKAQERWNRYAGTSDGGGRGR